MQLINVVSKYMNMIFFCAIFSIALVGAVLWYFLKVKKLAAKVENIDTSHFKRKDSISYVPIKDIIYDGNLDSPGVIVLSDTEFVAGLSIKGFNYNSASNAERVNAQVNAIAFFNVVEEPVSFRQSVKAIDLSANIEEYEQVRKRIATEAMELDDLYQRTIAMAEQFIDAPDEYRHYEEELIRLQGLIAAKNHMLDETTALIGYMKSLSGDGAKSMKDKGGVRTSQMMFSFTYDPSKYSTELSKEEIYQKAQEALGAKARSYADALARCQFRATRLTCRELIGLIKKHNFPLTGDDARIEELLDSSYTSLFISSDSLMETQRKRVGDEIFEEKVRAYEEMVLRQLQQQGEEMEQFSQKLDEDTYEEASFDVRGGVTE